MKEPEELSFVSPSLLSQSSNAHHGIPRICTSARGPTSLAIVLIFCLALLQVKLEPFLLVAKGSKGALTAKTVQNAISAVSSLPLDFSRLYTSQKPDHLSVCHLSSLVSLCSPSCWPFLAFKRFALPSPPPPRPPFHSSSSSFFSSLSLFSCRGTLSMNPSDFSNSSLTGLGCSIRVRSFV